MTPAHLSACTLLLPPSLRIRIFEFWWGSECCFHFETGPQYVPLAGLPPTTLLLPSPVAEITGIYPHLPLRIMSYSKEM